MTTYKIHINRSGVFVTPTAISDMVMSPISPYLTCLIKSILDNLMLG